MSYGPSGIQQEGWTFEVPTQVGIEPSEHGQGEGRKAKKPCKHCGSRDRNWKGYCDTCYKARLSQNPRKQRAANWFPCSCCLAKVGFGCNIVAKLLDVTPSTVNERWAKAGVKRFIPPSGNWRQAVSVIYAENHKNEMRQQRILNEGMAYVLSRIKNDPFLFFEWDLNHFPEIMKDLRVIKRKRWLDENKDKRAAWHKEHRQKTKVQRAEYSKKWIAKKKEEDPEGLRVARRKAEAAARANPKHRARENVKCRFKEVMRSVKGGTSGSFSILLGCSRAQFRTHLERHFKRGMTWENYGEHWHVDHILPVASFDHSNPDHIKQCWHWTNLRPLEAKKNMDKGDLITHPQLQLLLCSTH